MRICVHVVPLLHLMSKLVYLVSSLKHDLKNCINRAAANRLPREVHQGCTGPMRTGLTPDVTKQSKKNEKYQSPSEMRGALLTHTILESPCHCWRHTAQYYFMQTSVRSEKGVYPPPPKKKYKALLSTHYLHVNQLLRITTCKTSFWIL